MKGSGLSVRILSNKKMNNEQSRWRVPVMPATGKPRPEDGQVVQDRPWLQTEFKTSLILFLCPYIKKGRNMRITEPTISDIFWLKLSECLM